MLRRKRKNIINNIYSDNETVNIGAQNKRFKIKGKNNYYSADVFDSHDVYDSHNQRTVNGSNYSSGRVLGGENCKIIQDEYNEAQSQEFTEVRDQKNIESEQGIFEIQKTEEGFTVNGDNVNLTDVSKVKEVSGGNVNINSLSGRTGVDEFQSIKMGKDGSLNIVVKNNGVNRTIKIPGGLGGISIDRGQGR